MTSLVECLLLLATKELITSKTVTAALVLASLVESTARYVTPYSSPVKSPLSPPSLLLSSPPKARADLASDRYQIPSRALTGSWWHRQPAPPSRCFSNKEEPTNGRASSSASQLKLMRDSLNGMSVSSRNDVPILKAVKQDITPSYYSAGTIFFLIFSGLSCSSQ
ncbi:hypothetical protein F5Y15DRAFT_240944 [Xylariaceae sp. FL0016]|nr:hypothetical protein F5Y15DRAFT_240944 [Xylariaceae sp. FL0016]